MTGDELVDLARYCSRECEDTPVMVLKLLEGLAAKVEELEARMRNSEFPVDMPTVPF